MDESWRTVNPLEQIMLDQYTPNKPDIITIVFSLARNVSLSWLQSHLIPRLLTHPRFSSHITTARGGAPRHHPLPDFTPASPSLAAHLSVEPVVDPTETPKERHRLFISRLSDLISAPLDMSRPLWHLHLFPHWSVAQRPDTCTIVLRVHHALADGVGLVKYFLAQVVDPLDATHHTHLLVPPRRSPASASRHDRVGRPSCVQRAANLARDLARDLTRILVRPFFRDPVCALTRGPLHDANLCALLSPSGMTVARLRATSKHLRVTINDLLLAACAGAVRAYVTEQGDDPQALHRLRAAMPFSRHAFDAFRASDVSNQLVMVPTGLPVHAARRADRLAQCARNTRQLKRGAQPALAAAGLRAIAALPHAARRRAWHRLAGGVSLLFSNVAGPREHLSVGGVRVESVFFLPPTDVHVGVGVGVFSYAGDMFVAASGDAGRLRRPGRLAGLVVTELEALVGMGAEAAAAVADANANANADADSAG